MFERCLYFNANSLARKLNSIWEERFASLGLHPSHAYLLRLVLNSPGISQQTLAKELRLNKSTITRFVEVLEKKDLVMRNSSVDDQREKLIHPTAKAMELHEQLEATGEELYSTMCQLFGKENLQVFVNNAREISEKL